MKNLNLKLSKAIKEFWITRQKQKQHQGLATGKKNTGNRSAVTGGAQLNGFIDLISSLLIECGLKSHDIIIKEAILPGFYRPSKKWDLAVISENILIASIEFKSHLGPSFGNNFNNRIEESIGSAIDVLTAFREGAFKPSQKPWLGYLILLEDHEKSSCTIKVKEPHFKVFDYFHNISYATRYELFCEKLVRERLYDSTCLILSDRNNGLKGVYKEPSEEFSFNNFVISLMSRVRIFLDTS